MIVIYDDLCEGRRRTFRYVEAVKTFGKFLEHKNLERAYDRAGPHFMGTFFLKLSANFLWYDRVCC